MEVVAETDAEELPEDHRTCVYRVVQEAAHNAVRHSGAHQIRIHVQLTAPVRLRVSIQDDGKGFAPSQSAGLGLLGMEERIHRLGGTMQVDPLPDSGTIVSFVFPPPAVRTHLPSRPDGLKNRATFIHMDGPGARHRLSLYY